MVRKREDGRWEVRIVRPQGQRRLHLPVHVRAHTKRTIRQAETAH